MNNLVYDRTYRVNTYEADASGRLSIPGLFNYLQDAAARHATVLKFGKEHLEKENRFWVLSRILVKMDTMPEWEKETIIRTWPRGVDKLFALRDFEVLGSNGKKYGGATSCWLMVNRKNRRPVRPDSLLEKLNMEMKKESSLERYPSKLPGLVNASYKSQVIPVRYSDLDINMHVNNVQYVKWAIDTYALDFILGNKFNSAEVNYLLESVPGDEITVHASELENNTFEHSVVRINDGRDLCRLKISWTT
ncbi:MAG: hypothetical protein JW965_06330 [Bacteroidales bacterium]|nr:hypothetical protein [Bacteroidales bacterium]